MGPCDPIHIACCPVLGLCCALDIACGLTCLYFGNTREGNAKKAEEGHKFTLNPTFPEGCAFDVESRSTLIHVHR